MKASEVKIPGDGFLRVIHTTLRVVEARVALELIEGKSTKRTLSEWMQFLDETVADIEVEADKELEKNAPKS